MELKKFLQELLEREAALSRKAIERVPEGRNTWKPHARSMELGLLAALVATMPGWITYMIDLDELDLNANGGAYRTKPVETRAELIAQFDTGLAAARKALDSATEEHLLKPWRLKMDDQILIETPRYLAIAQDALSHLAHHRGQFTVYLRLNDALVPALYGPSADEAH